MKGVAYVCLFVESAPSGVTMGLTFCFPSYMDHVTPVSLDRIQLRVREKIVLSQKVQSKVNKVNARGLLVCLLSSESHVIFGRQV